MTIEINKGPSVYFIEKNDGVASDTCSAKMLIDGLKALAKQLDVRVEDLYISNVDLMRYRVMVKVSRL